jgi:hypothetical protein
MTKRPCLHCAKLFTPKRRNRLLCSERCRAERRNAIAKDWQRDPVEQHRRHARLHALLRRTERALRGAGHVR